MNNKLLIYDDQCALCSWYSGLFVKYGLIQKEGRVPFSTLDQKIMNTIDLSVGRNEIPLVDPGSGKVTYGIDALLDILGTRFPYIRKAGNIQPVNWMLKRLYNFISFNRKVIVAKKCNQGQIDCSPELNIPYRVLFMTVFLVFNTLMLFPLHENVLTTLPFYSQSAFSLQLAHATLVASNLLLSFRMEKARRIEYLGQVNMLALIAILLLIPLLMIQTFVHPAWWVTLLYLGMTTLVVYKEFMRRMDYAGVLNNHPWIISINLLCLTGFILFLF